MILVSESCQDKWPSLPCSTGFWGLVPVFGVGDFLVAIAVSSGCLFFLWCFLLLVVLQRLLCYFILSVVGEFCLVLIFLRFVSFVFCSFDDAVLKLFSIFNGLSSSKAEQRKRVFV